jgi:hypothetical protein
MDPLRGRFDPAGEGRRRAKHLVGPRLTVVFYGVDEALVEACRPLARALPFARAQAKRIDAACAAVTTLEDAMLVVPEAVHPGERKIIETHVREVDVPVLWISAEHGHESNLARIESWATAALRLPR